ncbi:MAG: LytR C-terminal domain-containing protein [Candidatus Zixiibacteriota bacterium]
MRNNKLFKKVVRRKSSKTSRKNSRLLEMAIVVIFAMVVIYAASLAIRVTHGISKTVDSPEYTIRLQILNGCGTTGAANKVSKALPGLIKLPIEVNIVDIDDFNDYPVKESFLISRNSDSDPIEILSEQLNLLGDISYKPMENNYRSISATLVLGEDFEKFIKEPSI